VLLVEDDEAVRALFRRILQAKGYTVLESREGSDALRVCEKHVGPVHLLVADVVMPLMTGRQLVDRLLLLRPTMKVLYLSGHSDSVLLRHGVTEAGVPCLRKPLAPDDLARKVREILNH
jgi:CheY-like chemotaxis protein